jgi:hypothetical protein
MDFVKVQEAIGKCEKLISDALGSTTALERIPAGEFHHNARVILYHCIDMIKQMRDWPAERLEKSFRWLGYIQGVMETLGVADLETLKNMNKPTEEDEKREKAAEDPLPKLKAELQRRLDSSKNVSTDELIRLTDLAEKIEEAQHQKAARREAVATLREIGAKLAPGIIASLTSSM